jgi:hypothetical protein
MHKQKEIRSVAPAMVKQENNRTVIASQVCAERNIKKKIEFDKIKKCMV